MKIKRAYSMTARSASAAQTQQRILSAARARFLACPYEEVTLAGVAEDAGVSTQTVLNGFGTKECLFLAFAAEFFGEMDALRSSVRRGDPRSAVRVVLHGLVKPAAGNGRLISAGNLALPSWCP